MLLIPFLFFFLILIFSAGLTLKFFATLIVLKLGNISIIIEKRTYCKWNSIKIRVKVKIISLSWEWFWLEYEKGMYNTIKKSSCEKFYKKHRKMYVNIVKQLLKNLKKKMFLFFYFICYLCLFFNVLDVCLIKIDCDRNFNWISLNIILNY